MLCVFLLCHGKVALSFMLLAVSLEYLDSFCLYYLLILMTSRWVNFGIVNLQLFWWVLTCLVYTILLTLELWLQIMRLEKNNWLGKIDGTFILCSFYWTSESASSSSWKKWEDWVYDEGMWILLTSTVIMFLKHNIENG